MERPRHRASNVLARDESVATIGSRAPDSNRNVDILPFDERRESFAELTRLVNAAYRQLGDMGLNYVAVDEGSDVTRSRVMAASACWVARSGDNLVGTICYYNNAPDRAEPEWYRQHDVCHFGQLAVEPALQGSGIGSLLIDTAEAQAVTDGKSEFSCDTADRAEHLIAFYARRGLRIVGQHKWPHGNYDSLVLSKRLGVSIRAATDADLPSILSITSTTPWDKRDFLTGMLSRKSIDVACEGGRVVGFNVWNREFFSRPLIWLVVIDRNWRRQGIGSLLFAHTERECKGTRLYSSTNRSNELMRRFHARRGYRFAGELELDPGDPEIFYCIDL